MMTPPASTALASAFMFESEAGKRRLLLQLFGALFAGGIVTLLVLPGPEQSSSALHQSNHSLLSTCGRLHAEALRAHSVAEAALSQLQAEAEINRRDAKTCETGAAVCIAERVEWQRSAAEGAALLSACEAAAASSAATCEAAGKEACEMERERERERADAEVVAAVSECEAAAAMCQAEAASCQAERQAERLSLEARISELRSSEHLSRPSEPRALRAAGKASEERAVASAAASLSTSSTPRPSPEAAPARPPCPRHARARPPCPRSPGGAVSL